MDHDVGRVLELFFEKLEAVISGIVMLCPLLGAPFGLDHRVVPKGWLLGMDFKEDESGHS